MGSFILIFSSRDRLATIAFSGLYFPMKFLNERVISGFFIVENLVSTGTIVLPFSIIKSTSDLSLVLQKWGFDGNSETSLKL
ncbi:hypothetical protein A3A75_03065 [Candidatus Woesebacteria bacterium RIFCSPLOWO2_01_FULL_39_10]|uniref:Uncharacterized protein n=1 Tax=Candidatus Woesebacteria bacterium RIFCSPLOWO2_01_FULL_39_10 TaxID=1802516 RepID=A0A1F8B554_9BACT|nr:MAG: hypothetical protein A3A75_03065 [Candidatus Woesebacteria bacterium RIFCSPLOWO2_01_FULL_39_10]